MKKSIEKIITSLNTERIKRFKKIILFVFIALVLLDIYFVSNIKYPSISRVIYNSSPDYIVLIWFFGLFISNVFLQRKIANNRHIKRNFFILLTISIFYFILGMSIKSTTNINCKNYPVLIEELEIKYVTRILCQESDGGTFHYKNKNCKTITCTEKNSFKLDITNEMKFLILISGLIFGYMLWPKENEHF